MPTALPYEAPSLIRLLVFSSFLYTLNAARVIADYVLHGGVIAEIALGIIYGSPLANLLPQQWEETFTVLGYVGLILVVFEGGLSSNLPLLLSNLPLSTVCALVGIGLPIALSFALLNVGFGYHPLEAFAAGAALSSTSLGTTLAALNSVTKGSPASPRKRVARSRTSSSVHASADASLPTTRSSSPPSHSTAPTTPTAEVESSSLQRSRIGTVLISAAIIDDVIGLVIAAVIPALSSAQSESSQDNRGSLAWTMIRPLLSSLLIAVISPLISRFLLRPLFWYHGIGELWCTPARPDKPWGTHSFARIGSGWGTERHADASKLFLMVAVLSAMAAISYYASTSILYGAYIAGLILTYVSQPPPHKPSENQLANNHHSLTVQREHDQRINALSFEEAFSRVIGPIQEHLLLPLFFASIGFAIPFLDLWHPTIIWRGVVYSILMCLAKLAVGLPILLHAPGLHYASQSGQKMKHGAATLFHHVQTRLLAGMERSRSAPARLELPSVPSSSRMRDPPPIEKNGTCVSTAGAADSAAQPAPLHDVRISLPAAVFMGVAMVARGEIGLLIAQLARGDSSSSGGPGLLSNEPFLLCIWAILLCTLVGPITLGFIVRKWGARVNTGIWM
ncbi:hypothetical protein C2E23DRAFT_903097 [Lenzites betulinus]|nr:hypothetical protein C2E23DRAFT_903097 [Lenzites betulinus]